MLSLVAMCCADIHASHFIFFIHAIQMYTQHGDMTTSGIRHTSVFMPAKPLRCILDPSAASLISVEMCPWNSAVGCM
jgi:hypothetical protein